MKSIGITSPFSSMKPARSASPSNATPKAYLPGFARTSAWRSFSVSVLSGFASWFGNAPSNSSKSPSYVSGEPLNAAASQMPMPFAKSHAT